ncbi:hypothetical protein IQ254_15405 [Nodosilinea sp. LEGE 07088]|uniref:hypothetical protein n=1 Tax=Nodosilinea sp. LEGE 07088 TaxID=2777968 RepID=UPI00187FEEDC|nr:hypothetical protein [Nodosilinea sp. LEGE 07088]MBE9138561.1 hypothetical protein [Nodosilinea sp. LEGE 07088]
MNVPFSPESAYSGTVASEAPQASRQAPSVPISVYRELATELRTNQAMVDSLTQQNQQLTQQNQVLRQEMIRFADSAARLKQAIESSQPQPVEMTATVRSPLEVGPSETATSMPLYPVQAEDDLSDSLPERLSESVGEGVSTLASQITQMVKPKGKKAKPPQRPQAKPPQRLYTEERLDPNRPGQMSQRPSDLSGLWLSATILLIVVSAFGAGFLIMKPLLSNSR